MKDDQEFHAFVEESAHNIVKRYYEGLKELGMKDHPVMSDAYIDKEARKLAADWYHRFPVHSGGSLSYKLGVAAILVFGLVCSIGFSVGAYVEFTIPGYTEYGWLGIVCAIVSILCVVVTIGLIREKS